MCKNKDLLDNFQIHYNIFKSLIRLYLCSLSKRILFQPQQQKCLWDMSDWYLQQQHQRRFMYELSTWHNHAGTHRTENRNFLWYATFEFEKAFLCCTVSKVKIRYTLEFSLNAFTEFAEFSDIKIKIKKENCRVGTQDLLCKRQRFYHCTTETIVREQILILNPVHASVISQILWIPWIQWKFCSIRRKLHWLQFKNAVLLV